MRLRENAWIMSRLMREARATMPVAADVKA